MRTDTPARKLLPLLFLLALVATACRAEVNFAIEVLEDGSGSAFIEAGVDEELAAVLPDGTDPLDLLAGQFDLSNLSTSEVEPFDRDGLMFRSLRVDFEDVDTLSREFISDPATPFRDLTVQLDDAGMSVAVTVELPDLGAAAGALGLPVDGAALTDNEVLASHVRMSLPGTIEMHDADRVLPNGDLEWDLPLTGGVKTLTAQTVFENGSFAWLPVAGAGLAIALVAGVALFAGKSRRKKEVAAIAAAQEAEPWTPPEPIADSPNDITP